MHTSKTKIVGSILLFIIVLGYYLYPSKPHTVLQRLQASNEEITDVVIIVVDTLRADILPWHRGEEQTAPFLASLAKQSMVFDRAYADCSSTAPALASVFTGRYPSRHGVITGFLAHKRLVAKTHDLTLNRIPRTIETLPEFFKNAGFKTLGVADNLNISKELGFEQGFDSLTTTRNVGAERVTNTALSWKNKGGDKRLFYIHYMDPHAPYERATPWIDAVQKHTKPHISAYKSEIRRVDEHIRKLFKQKLWKKDALIIFLADHGESFGEHDATGHGKNLHTEVVRVPFFIAHPKLKPRRIRQVVHTADILPTLADIFGWQSDENWQGESLLTQEAYGRPIFSELLRPQEHPRTSEESVITNNYQLIVAGTNNADMRLYNIREDLDQNNNLVNEKPDQARKMLKLLAHHRETSPQDGEETVIKMDSEGLEHLKTLGYLQ